MGCSSLGFLLTLLLILLFLGWDLIVNPKIPLLLGLVIGISGCAPLIPLFSYFLQARRLKFGVYLEQLYFALFSVLGFSMLFLGEWLAGHWENIAFSKWEAIFWTAYFVFTSIAITVIIDCYMTRLLKKRIHERRMET